MTLNTSDSWALNELLRFPVGAEGWEDLPPPEEVHPLTLYSSRDKYSLVIAQRSVAEIMQMLALLIHSLPTDFDAAAKSITPEGWRQLHYRGAYALECLITPRFQAHMELRRICAQHELYEDAPTEWIGTDRSLLELAKETELAIREAGPDVAKAVWAVLSTIQHVPLTKAEILKCRWWEPAWLKALFRHLNRLLKKSHFKIHRKRREKMTLRNRPKIDDLDQVEAQASLDFGRFFAMPTFSAAC